MSESSPPYGGTHSLQVTQLKSSRNTQRKANEQRIAGDGPGAQAIRLENIVVSTY